MQAGLVIGGLGIVLSVIGLFLPWVKASFVSVALPILEGAIGALYPEIAGIISQFGSYSSITGLDALTTAELIDSSFRVIVALPVIYAIFALVGILILLRAGSEARVLSAIMASVGVVVTVLLVFNIPNLTRLGYGDNWIAAAAVAILGFSPDIGFWLSFFGSVAITAGMALCTFAGQNTSSATDSSLLEI